MLKGLNLLLSAKPFVYKKTQVLSLPRDLVYSTVLDVPSYSRFLPWCKQSHWIDDASPPASVKHSGERKARLTVDYKLLQESYVSKVTFEPLCHIKAVAADSDLFETLDTVWELKEQGDGTCIDFYINFKFHLGLYQGISAALSHTLTNTMLEHFVKECHRRHKERVSI
ncbi:coenzyme Q-binding protein COQ10 [Babesia caballi]|uniref:Coenzyme Q-binding protein COQ10 n=1 Tax=Babesia caballi TaxID=5871 RepID=A0AAV4LP49_BABCB|nr:coenzyme Q-binding protein COQ10 [Babesia caballi]